jgi:hypothetical protein
MSVQLVIEVPDAQGAQVVLNALESYKARLRANIERTSRNLQAFEQRHGVSTTQFLTEGVAEDLSGGDLEYVDWAGEAKLLDGLESELTQLERAQYQLR